MKENEEFHGRRDADNEFTLNSRHQVILRREKGQAFAPPTNIRIVFKERLINITLVPL